jgi:hypothetical protein
MEVEKKEVTQVKETPKIEKAKEEESAPVELKAASSPIPEALEASEVQEEN